MKNITRAQLKELIALFLFSVALLSIQISFTKFFSVVLWYHFGFMIISTAMLGFSVSGVFLSLFPKHSEKFTFSTLISVSSAVTLVCYIFMTRIQFTPLNLINQNAGLFSLISLIVLLFIPFFLLGLTIGWLLAQRKERIGLYYSVNMTGSAAGALLFIFIFNNFNGQIGIPLNIALMITAALFASENLFQRAFSAALLATITPLLFIPSFFPMEPPEDKILGLVKNRKSDVVFTDWSSLSKIDMIKDVDRSIYRSIGMWGISKNYMAEGKRFPERTGIVIDSWAYTSIIRYPQDLAFFDYMPTALVFNLGRNFGSTLHIGSGGGMDLLAAKYHNVKEIKGVEINPVIVRAIQNEFREYSGGIYSGGIEGISVSVDEGRHFIESSKKKYDVIQLSGVDTFSSTHAGAFALSENNLYSTEAFQSYFKRLNDNGFFTMTSWFSPDENGIPRFSVRLINIIRDSLDKLGMDPENRVLFIVSDVYTVAVVKNGVFTPDEVLNAKNYIDRNAFTALVVPFEKLNDNNIFEKFLYADDETSAAMIDNYPYIVSAPTDDKPFFFELRKLSTLFSGINAGVLPLNIFSGQTILFAILVILFFLGIIFIIQPLYFLKRRDRTSLKPSGLIYFSLIGMGYMFVEIVLTQKLVLYLGHPSYSLSLALFSILLFSGLGSLATDLLDFGKRTTLLFLTVILTVLVILLPFILNSTLSSSFGIRVAITLSMLAPVSFLMGCAFPAGARRATVKELPFLWGINGFFSVIASVLSTIISINYGFTSVFLCAIACYCGAALIMFFNFKEGATK